jgi:hypothetical protein
MPVPTAALAAFASRPLVGRVAWRRCARAACSPLVSVARRASGCSVSLSAARSLRRAGRTAVLCHATSGYTGGMDAEVLIASVKTSQTRNGNTRWTVTDDSDTEYTTFREAIGKAAEEAEGSRARISFHEEERKGFRNVYLDKVERIAEQRSAAGAADESDPDEAAWRTAVDAAPYLLDEEAVKGKVTPEEAFETLKPFKDLVSDDIRSGGKESGS